MFIIRLATSADEGVYHSYDTANIALAVQNYNIADERPHLPGYYLYVIIIRLVNKITSDTHTSIILLQAIFSAGGISILFLLLMRYFDKRTSFIVTLLAATSPLLWFYGSVTEIYSFDLFFSLLFVYIGLDSKRIYILPVLLAFGAGVRQSSAIILFPLYVFFWYRYLKNTRNYREFLISNLAGFLFLLVWLFAMFSKTGGVSGYLNLVKSQNPVPKIDMIKNVYQMFIIGFWLFFPVMLLWVYLKIKKLKFALPDDLKWVVVLWLLPAVLVFVFIHYTRGYLLIAAGGLYVLTAALSQFKAARILIVVLLLFQILYFLFMPYRLNRADIFFVPQQRSISAVETQIDRLLSLNALTLSNIRQSNRMFAAMKKQISTGGYKYFLIDRSVPYYARGLQAEFPSHLFAEINPLRQDGWFLYSDMRQYNLNGRKNMLDSALIVGVVPFVNLIDTNVIIKKHQEAGLVFYKVSDKKSAVLDSIYNKYFQKIY